MLVCFKYFCLLVDSFCICWKLGTRSTQSCFPVYLRNVASFCFELTRGLTKLPNYCNKSKKLLHFSICACHPCAGAMLIFSVSFQFYRMIPEGNPTVFSFQLKNYFARFFFRIRQLSSRQKEVVVRCSCHMCSDSVSCHCKQCSVWPALLPASACAWNIIHQDISFYNVMPLWLACLAWVSHQRTWSWQTQLTPSSMFRNNRQSPAVLYAATLL